MVTTFYGKPHTQRTEHLPTRRFQGPGECTAPPKTPWRTSHPAQGLHSPIFAGMAPGVLPPSGALIPCAPSLRGPPGFVWWRRAAAAGLGPLAGYCRRIYCIAACAGCSPAHNRLAVAQGSTLRGKEGGIHPAADCRAFAAVSCRIRTLALDTPSPCSGLAEGPRGTHAAPSLSPPPNFMAGMFLVATWAGGHPACSPFPFGGPEGLRSLMAHRCCGGRRGPPRWVRRHKAGAGREPGSASSTN